MIVDVNGNRFTYYIPMNRQIGTQRRHRDHGVPVLYPSAVVAILQS